MTASGPDKAMDDARRDRDGFRIRGNEMTRTETFTDAAFAFAVTLLVVSIDTIPASYVELRDMLRHIPAFGMSFLLLAVFWYGHWNWSRRYGLEDVPTIALSLLLVFVMLSYVYPLKFLANIVVVWLSRGANGATGIAGFDELYGLFAIYGIGFSAMALILAALNFHAWRLRVPLDLSQREAYLTRGDVGAWSILAAVGALSAVVATVAEPNAFVLPGWTYMLLPVVMPLYGRRVNRGAAALPNGPG